jgi:hypothetical protein
MVNDTCESRKMKRETRAIGAEAVNEDYTSGGKQELKFPEFG